MTRTVWTNDEKKALFARMEEYFREKPNATRRDAMCQAQMVLDLNRRIVITDQRVFNYKDRIEIARRNARKSPPAKAPQAPAPILAPTPAPERKETPTERLAALFEQLLDVLADKVADRVHLRMLDAPPPAPISIAGRPKHDPRPVPSHISGIPRPGVLVIGLLPAQAHHVSGVLADKLDLSFFSPEEAVTYPTLLRAHTVLMTKFINHSVQEKYRKAPKLHFCNGGVATLMELLEQILRESGGT